MKKLLQGKELEEQAKELGIDIHGPLHTQSTSGRSPRANDSELQRRVIEAKRSIRESNSGYLRLYQELHLLSVLLRH